MNKELQCANCHQSQSNCDCGDWEPDYSINMHGEKVPQGCYLGFYCNYPECHCRCRPLPHPADKTEITISDVLRARLQAAIDCINLNDLDGCKYSLKMAIKIIEEN